MEKSYERLEKLIEWSGLSIHDFAMKIGIKRSESIYRIIRNKENIDIELVLLIREVYPEISRDWLVYGKGEMRKPLCREEDFIPYFEQPHLEPVFNMIIPIFNADFAKRMTDGALEPKIPINSLIAVKKIRREEIVCGKIYHVQTENFTVVRIVRKSGLSEGELILKVVNENDYDDIVINLYDIINVHLVCGVVSLIN